MLERLLRLGAGWVWPVPQVVTVPAVAEKGRDAARAKENPKAEGRNSKERINFIIGYSLVIHTVGSDAPKQRHSATTPAARQFPLTLLSPSGRGWRVAQRNANSISHSGSASNGVKCGEQFMGGKSAGDPVEENLVASNVSA